MTEKENELLLARALELCRRAENGEIAFTQFLTPGQQKYLSRCMPRAAVATDWFGGYRDAERKRLFFLPPYFEGLDEETRSALLAESYAESVLPLRVKGSGYHKLTHRDFLGAALNLGIERDAIGDLSVVNEHEAILFCDALMARFLMENLSRVAGDAVRVSTCVLPPDFDGGRRFEQVTDTVASPRADAVVGALCNLSRENAKALFLAARVEIDEEVVEKYDKEVAAGAILVVRGHGKFIIRSLSDKTKKGRFRLLADRYV